METTYTLGAHLVILQDFEKDKAEQLWKKGETNAEGYFTLMNSKVPQVATLNATGEAVLENSKVPMIMTATSSIRLEIQGNITQKTIFCSFLIIYNVCFFTYRNSN